MLRQLLFHVKTILFISLFLYVIFHVSVSNAQSSPRLYFFYGEGCPHCAKQKLFLDELDEKYPNNKFDRFEVYYDQQNQNKLKEVSEELNVKVSGVPFTVVGDKYFVGFGDKSTTGKEIEEALIAILNSDNKSITQVTETNSDIPEESENIDIQKPNNIASFRLPILGEIDPNTISLPILAMTIGFVDGFNPCAMWVLLFLISVLIPIQSKKRRWFIGISFIVSSAVVYFMFLAAWLNLFLFINYIGWIKTIIGIFSIFAGIYFLRDYFYNKDGGCKVVNENERQFFFSRIKNLVTRTNLFALSIGIILLAFSVNLIELVCSAGLPAIFTHILSLSNLPTIQYYLYLLLYVLFFMIDDILILVIAMKTLELVGIQNKYSRYSHLVGGLLMLILGFILVFKPELLMFG